jgi:hypothetical protein
MSKKLKVEFIDNSATQYDSNASLIDYGAAAGQGQLYLGDRFSSSFVQLKARNCKTVVSCCVDMHGFAKEADVNYLKIDPDDEGNDHFDEAFKFIDANLSKNKNVVVYCENGFSKSAVILCYFLMKKRSISLGQSYNILQKCRGGMRLPPRLVTLLMQAEKKQRGINSIKLDGKFVTVLDGRLDLSGGRSPVRGGGKVTKGSNTGMYVGIGVAAFFGILYAILVAVTGKK